MLLELGEQGKDVRDLEAVIARNREGRLVEGRCGRLPAPCGRRLLPAESGFEVTLDADGADPAHAFAGVADRIEARDAGEGRWTVRLYGTGDDIAGRAVEASRRAGAELVDLRRIEGSLEDVFVHLTGRELR